MINRLIWICFFLQYVGRDDDDSIAAGSEVSDDAVSWETVNDDEMDALENAQEVCFCLKQ